MRINGHLLVKVSNKYAKIVISEKKCFNLYMV